MTTKSTRNFRLLNSRLVACSTALSAIVFYSACGRLVDDKTEESDNETKERGLPEKESPQSLEISAAANFGLIENAEYAVYKVNKNVAASSDSEEPLQKLVETSGKPVVFKLSEELEGDWVRLEAVNGSLNPSKITGLFGPSAVSQKLPLTTPISGSLSSPFKGKITRFVKVKKQKRYNLSPVSTILTNATAEKLNKQKNLPFEEALNQTVKKFGTAVGMNISESSLDGAEELSQNRAQSLPEAKRIFLISQGLLGAAQKYDGISVDEYMNALSIDFADGIFDGKAADGSNVPLGSGALNPNAWTEDVAKAIAEFVATTNSAVFSAQDLPILSAGGDPVSATSDGKKEEIFLAQCSPISGTTTSKKSSTAVNFAQGYLEQRANYFSTIDCSGAPQTSTSVRFVAKFGPVNAEGIRTVELGEPKATGDLNKPETKNATAMRGYLKLRDGKLYELLFPTNAPGNAQSYTFANFPPASCNWKDKEGVNTRSSAPECNVPSGPGTGGAGKCHQNNTCSAWMTEWNRSASNPMRYFITGCHLRRDGQQHSRLMISFFQKDGIWHAITNSRDYNSETDCNNGLTQFKNDPGTLFGRATPESNQMAYDDAQQIWFNGTSQEATVNGLVITKDSNNHPKVKGTSDAGNPYTQTPQSTIKVED